MDVPQRPIQTCARFERREEHLVSLAKHGQSHASCRSWHLLRIRSPTKAAYVKDPTQTGSSTEMFEDLFAPFRNEVDGGRVVSDFWLISAYDAHHEAAYGGRCKRNLQMIEPSATTDAWIDKEEHSPRRNERTI